jgi:hypothetical protein
MTIASVGTALISIELEIGTVITAQGSLVTIITEFHISIVPKLVLRHACEPQAGANRD